jgi:hypothetical protein
MFNFIKWFWTNISFRNWTFEGRKLSHPITITRKIIIFPFLFASVIIYCITVAIFEFDIQSGLDAFSEQF